MSSYVGRRFLIPLLVAALGACSDAPTKPLTEPVAELHRVPLPDTGTGLWRASLTGTVGGTAEYAMYIPRIWNGDVVFYAHGFVAPQEPVALPAAFAPLRDGLGAMGYAVAYSSYGENGYAIAEGIWRTRQLRYLFNARVGAPKHAYLMGHSLGGQVVEALAEQAGREFDGAMAYCGVLGGTRMETQYIGHLRTVFDFFYPGVLPGNTDTMPVITDPNVQIVGPALAAIKANPSGFGAMLQIDQTRMAGRNTDEQIATLLQVLALHALEVNDLTARTNGHPVYDNSKVTYTSATLPPPVVDALNAGVRRYASTFRAKLWLQRNYQPSGRLRMPMLTLHKTQDWLVPFAHEAEYQDIAAEAGRSELLRQRSVDSYGHCEFTPDATMANFLDLVKWVTTGTVPAP